MSQVVAKLDHVYVPFDDARAAFDVFSGELRLPVMWPFDSYGVLTSGTVVLGNLHLETLQSLRPSVHPLAPPSMTAVVPARVSGLAFEPAPDIDTILAELDRRGVTHTAPHPGPQPEEPMFANILLPELSSDRLLVWLYHSYPAAAEQHLHASGIPDMRGELGRAALEAAGGGRLGVREVDELVVGVPDVDHEARLWQRLFDPLQPKAPNCWRPEGGPAIRLVPSTDRGVERVVLRVNDVAAARATWAATDQATLCGLTIEFTS